MLNTRCISQGLKRWVALIACGLDQVGGIVTDGIYDWWNNRMSVHNSTSFPNISWLACLLICYAKNFAHAPFFKLCDPVVIKAWGAKIKPIYAEIYYALYCNYLLNSNFGISIMFEVYYFIMSWLLNNKHLQFHYCYVVVITTLHLVYPQVKTCHLNVLCFAAVN